MIVVIDDERTFDTEDEVTYLRTEDEALLFLTRWFVEWNYGRAPSIDALYLDHDLGENQDIVVVVRFLGLLKNVKKAVLKVFIHTQNPVGAQNMWTDCSRFSNHVERIPLPALKTKE
jgi:hypothetical protein